MEFVKNLIQRRQSRVSDAQRTYRELMTRLASGSSLKREQQDQLEAALTTLGLTDGRVTEDGIILAGDVADQKLAGEQDKRLELSRLAQAEYVATCERRDALVKQQKEALAAMEAELAAVSDANGIAAEAVRKSLAARMRREIRRHLHPHLFGLAEASPLNKYTYTPWSGDVSAYAAALSDKTIQALAKEVVGAPPSDDEQPAAPADQAPEGITETANEA